MVKDTEIYLKLILEAIGKIESFVDSYNEDDFADDYKTQSAVLMQFQIIGELSKKIGDEVKNKITLPWKEISGFRDIISHDYFNIEPGFVWKTITDDLPEMKEQINNYFLIK